MDPTPLLGKSRPTQWPDCLGLGIDLLQFNPPVVLCVSFDPFFKKFLHQKCGFLSTKLSKEITWMVPYNALHKLYSVSQHLNFYFIKERREMSGKKNKHAKTSKRCRNTTLGKCDKNVEKTSVVKQQQCRKRRRKKVYILTQKNQTFHGQREDNTRVDVRIADWSKGLSRSCCHYPK